MAYSFNGGAYISRAGPSIAGSHTMACVINPSSWSLGGIDGVMAKGQWGGDGNGDCRFTIDNGNLRYEVYTSTGSFTASYDAQTNLSTGADYWLCGTFDGSTVKLYVNGTERASTGTSGTLTNNAKDLVFGAYPGNLGGTGFEGNIAEGSLWNRVLTTTEIGILADGFSALTIPRGLYFHAPLVASPIDLFNSISIDVVFTSFASHPAIRMPAPPSLGTLLKSAIGVGSAIMQPATASASGSQSLSGSGSPAIQALQTAAQGGGGFVGQGAATVQALLASVAGRAPFVGAGSPSVQSLLSSASGAQGLSGAAIAVMQYMEASGAGVHFVPPPPPIANFRSLKARNPEYANRSNQMRNITVEYKGAKG